MKFVFLRILKSFCYYFYAIFICIAGKNIKIGRRVILSLDSELKGNNLINDDCRLISAVIGEYSYVSPQSILVKCNVGRYTSIGPGCKIGLGNHPIVNASTSPYIYNAELFKKRRDEDFDSVYIGHDCWIGANVMIVGGVKVGNGVVIGAGSVITKDIPDFAVVVGVPGKVVKYRFGESEILRINNLCWWDMDVESAKKVLL